MATKLGAALGVIIIVETPVSFFGYTNMSIQSSSIYQSSTFSKEPLEVSSIIKLNYI